MVFLIKPWMEKKTGGWVIMVQVGFDIVSTLMQDTKLVAYMNVKHGQKVEKKEENLNWCIWKVTR